MPPMSDVWASHDRTMRVIEGTVIGYGAVACLGIAGTVVAAGFHFWAGVIASIAVMVLAIPAVAVIQKRAVDAHRRRLRF